ncbi:hypothetical protein FSP39_012083 [Pinctada imbricata]|uniref:Novel STAND NTPase 3 domain-containing protein n=1 Tax=Pinctada imbricata TaxID=66713 RepID=A0AA88Y3Q8_PINIB|nr:hypothetical protein FSP39_012083 [Pinctada imbricata]
MAHELMLEITKMNSSYSPVIINEPSQWDEIVDGSRSLVIFIDDIFGKTNLDKKYLSAWEKRFDAMWACSSEGKVLLIIGCRKNILEEGKSTFEKYDLFKDEHTMDLSSPRYELSSNDKTGILMSYCIAFGVQTPSIPFDRNTLDKVLSHEEIRTIAQQRTLVGFPQLCNLFFTKPSFFEKGIDFFIHASEELVKDISFLRRRKRSEYAVLLYALLKNNCILSDDLDEQLMTDVCKVLNTSTLDCTDVQDLIVEQPLIAYLERSPVKKPLYQLKHITIFEAVLKSVSTSYPEFLLEHAHPNVLMSYIRSAN